MLAVVLLGTAVVAPMATATAAPRASGKTIITPDQARQLVTDYDTKIAAADATLDRAAQAKIEGGPALAIDDRFYVANKEAGLPFPAPQTPTTTEVFVPRQANFPASFVAYESFDQLSEIRLFERPSAQQPWKLTLYAHSSPPAAAPTVSTDSDGYAIKAQPKGLAIRPSQIAARTCDELKVTDTPTGTFGDLTGLGTYSSYIANTRQQAQQNGQTFTLACHPLATPLVTVATDGGGALALYATQSSFITSGSKANPIVVTKAKPGEAHGLAPGKYLQQTFTDMGMWAATINTPDPTPYSSPAELPFGYDSDTAFSGKKA